MAVEKSISSGSTPMLLLKLLSEKDMYGYEIIETLKNRSNNVFEMRAGTLYPLLRNLVNQKCLTSYEEEVNGKLRKYYSLTLIGRKVLEEKQKTWHEYSSAVISVIGNA
jgi:DNA-binding PadR family transcriptional regulator